MTKPAPHSEIAGFTLAETLVAVFAFALLMTAGTSMLLSTLGGQRLVQERGDRLRSMQLLTAHMTADLAGVQPRIISPTRAGDGPQSLSGGEPDRDGAVLAMVRGGWTNLEGDADRSDLLAVQYRIEDNRLVRRVWARPDRVRATPFRDDVLIDGLETVSVRFLAEGEPAPEWQFVEQGDGVLMPDAVRVELGFTTGETLSQLFLVGARS